MDFFCECCNYRTFVKANFNKHMQSIKHMKVSQKLGEVRQKLGEVSQKLGDSLKCKYCEKVYKHKSSLSKHIKYLCTKNKTEDLTELVRLLNLRLEQQEYKIETQTSQIESQFKKIETQSKQIDKLMGKLEINGSFNTTNIQNITLLSYRDTDTSHLTDHDYKSCIKKVNYCVKHMIEKIHFNPCKPENMNIYISNIKDKYIMVYDGHNWNLANKKEELERLYEEKEMMLEEWLETNPEKELKEKFMKYLNNKESDECLNRIKEDIKLMLYNKKMIEC
jgi:hypothetical protein